MTFRWTFTNPAANDESGTLKVEGITRFALQVKKTAGAATTWTVKLQSSLNMTDWEDLLTATEATTPATIQRIVDKPTVLMKLVLSAVGAGGLTLECVVATDQKGEA